MIDFLRKKQRWALLPLDCFLAGLSFYVSWVLRFGSLNPESWPAFFGWESYTYLFILQTASAGVSLVFFGIYSRLRDYASFLSDIHQVAKAALFAVLLSVGATWLYNGMEKFPQSALVIQYMNLFLLLSFRSFIWRIVRELKLMRGDKNKRHTLLSGLEEAGHRKIQLEDLLGRDAVHLETENIRSALGDKNILITGAGGSIGSELCRQLLQYNPKGLVLLDMSENALYEIDHELCNNRLFHVTSVLGSVQDEELLDKIFRENNIQIVFHCAAYKHVPLMEVNPKKAFHNNVTGTIQLAKAAQNAGIEKFVMLSTDKAVNPSSIMGATKRIAELYLQNLAKKSSTRFLAVRFGNVLGSNGSVVSLFSKQIALGGPVTVTHPEIVRYFMTIPEAVGLVIQAGVMGKGGEIFILDMGEPVKIKELAEDMIRFSGLKPYEDINIKYTGLRPGEKLFEELFLPEENKENTPHKKIKKIGAAAGRSLEGLEEQIRELDAILNENDRSQLDAAISRIIPEYSPVYDCEETVPLEEGLSLREKGS